MCFITNCLIIIIIIIIVHIYLRRRYTEEDNQAAMFPLLRSCNCRWSVSSKQSNDTSWVNYCMILYPYYSRTSYSLVRVQARSVTSPIRRQQCIRSLIHAIRHSSFMHSPFVIVMRSRLDPNDKITLVNSLSPRYDRRPLTVDRLRIDWPPNDHRRVDGCTSAQDQKPRTDHRPIGMRRRTASQTHQVRYSYRAATSRPIPSNITRYHGARGRTVAYPRRDHRPRRHAAVTARPELVDDGVIRCRPHARHHQGPTEIRDPPICTRGRHALYALDNTDTAVI